MKLVRTIYPLFFVSLIVSACGGEAANTNTATSPGPEKVLENERAIAPSSFEKQGMTLITLEDQVFSQKITATGFIDVPPENHANISAFIGGYVKNLHLIEGEEVAKGDLLLNLENTEYIELQQHYLETVEQLKFLRSDYERQQTMFEENISSQKTFLKAESEYKTALARAKGLREKLQMLHISPKQVEAGNFTSSIPIYAPIKGIVNRIQVSEGMFISPTQTILEIIDPEDLHLELSIFEKNVLKLQEGQQIRFRIPEVASEDFSAEISHIGRAIDPEDRTLKVHAHLGDALIGNLAVGMFVQAEILTQAEELPSLPKAAVQSTENDLYVWTLKAKNAEQWIFERKPIEAKREGEDFFGISNAQALQGKGILFEDKRSL